jgi:quinol monooxygenase YgiN
MSEADRAAEGRLIHIVTLTCKDAEHATLCLGALDAYGRPDALSYGCASYEFGLKDGSGDTVLLVERWRDWADLDRLLTEKVVPRPCRPITRF